MKKKETICLKNEIDKTKETLNELNKKIEELGKYSSELNELLNKIQAKFDSIRNITSENLIEINHYKKIHFTWKQQVEKIKTDYDKLIGKFGGKIFAGAAAGVGVAAVGPYAAMGVATTFGVASTGTAISTLSGAAAINAALAWLGGGALVLGGGGMAAGNAFLYMAGPIGIGIAVVSFISSGLMFWKASDKKKKIERIFLDISDRDQHCYKLSITEINERITRIVNETKMLKSALEEIEKIGNNFEEMSEDQQYELGTYVNLKNASTQLLVEPILGMTPKFNENDYEKYISWEGRQTDFLLNDKNKKLIISFSELLYKIKLTDEEVRILYSFFKKDKKMLKAFNIKREEFKKEVLEASVEALSYSYNYRID